MRSARGQRWRNGASHVLRMLSQSHFRPPLAPSSSSSLLLLLLLLLSAASCLRARDRRASRSSGVIWCV